MNNPTNLFLRRWLPSVSLGSMIALSFYFRFLKDETIGAIGGAVILVCLWVLFSGLAYLVLFTVIMPRIRQLPLYTKVIWINAALSLGFGLALALRFAMPEKSLSLSGRWETGPDRGRVIQAFEGTTWEQTHQVFEIHANDPSDAAQDAYNSRFIAKIPEILRRNGRTLRFLVTQPDWAVFDANTGKSNQGGDGVMLRFTASSAQNETKLGEINLNLIAYPASRSWQPVEITIPAGIEQLIVEAFPGNNNWFDRIWLTAEPTLMEATMHQSLAMLLFAAEGLSLGLLVFLFSILIWKGMAWANRLPRLGFISNILADVGASVPAIKVNEVNIRPVSFLAELQVLALLLVVTFFIFSSGVILPFGIHDDYSWTNLRSNPGFLNTLWVASLQSGRFFTGLYNYPFWRPESIASISLFRVINIICVGILSFFLYLTWRRTEPRWISLNIGLLNMAMPPIQILIAGSNFQIIPLGGVFAGMAVYFIEGSISQISLKRKYLLLILGIFLFWIALNIYQPVAMYYWVICVIFLFSKQETLRRTIGHAFLQIGSGFSGLALAFVTLKLGQYITHGLNSRAIMANNLPEKLSFFLRALMTSLNFNIIYHNENLAGGMGIFIVLGLICYFKGKILHRLGYLTIAFVFIPLTILHNLVIADNWLSYRTQISLVAILVVYSYFAFKGYLGLFHFSPDVQRKTSSIFISVITFAALVLALYSFITFYSTPLFLEHRFLKSQLLKADLSSTEQVYLIPSNWSDTTAPKPIGDEFGIPATCVPNAAIALTRLILREINPAYWDLPIQVINDAQNMPVISPDSVLVDMRRLLELK